MTQKMNNDLDFRRFWRACRRNWWLFALAAAICFGAAYIYGKIRMPVYSSQASVLIENSDIGNPLAAMASKSAAGGAAKMLGFGNSDVKNEKQLMFSNQNLTDVVHKTGLNITYVERNGLTKQVLYPESPIEARIGQETLDSLSTGVAIKLRNRGGRLDVCATSGFMGMKTLAVANNVTLPYRLRLKPLGITVELQPSAGYDPARDFKIDIIVTGTKSIISDLRKDVSTVGSDKNSDAIVLSFDGPNKTRNEAVLDAIMERYNERRLERRRETSLNELNYCTDRLEKLYAQLSESEQKVEDFKRENNLAALAVDSASWVVRSIGGRDKMMEAQNRLTYYDQVLYTINHDPDAFIVPLAGQTPDPLATQYNTLLSERQELERSAKSDHPAMREINAQISDIKNSITKSYSQIIDLQRRNIESNYGLQGDARESMAQLPALERQLLDMLRDRTIKNQLYIYLLQRRESAELTLYSTDTPGFIVDKAFTYPKPDMYKTHIAYAVALVLTLLGPALLLYILMRLRDRVRQPMDVAFLGVEKNTVLQTVGDNGLRGLRTLLTSKPDTGTVYVVNLLPDAADGSELENRLVDSFNNVDIPAARLMVTSPDGSNDVLLTNSVKEKREALLKDHRLILVDVPSKEHLADIVQLADAPDAVMLVLLRANKIRRHALKKILKGQIAEKVYVLITRRNTAEA